MAERKDIKSKYKWDLSVIYSDLDTFTAECVKLKEMIEKYPAHQSTMLSGAKELYSALSELTKMTELLEVLSNYAFLNFAVENHNNTYQSINAKVRNLAVEMGTASWFVSPYLLKLEHEKLESWYKECPKLEAFRRQIDKNLRYKPHTLSDEGEQLLARVQDCLGTHDNIRGIFANSDLRFGKITDENGKKVELTDTNYVAYLMSPVRRVRQNAFRCIYKTYEQFTNTFATMLDGRIKEACTMAKLRNFDSSITSSTFDDEVTPEIYNNLIESVHAGLPSLYGYYDLKREVLGVDRLHLYDIYTPLIGALDRKYSYEEGVEEVLDTVKIFGDEYYSTLKKGILELGWIDVYPSRGKQGGAFSSGCPGTEPYMMLNYTDTFDDIFTLAHEAGHSMHSYFTFKNNTPQDSSYTLFVAEVASTVNELLLAHKKLNESKSDDEKMYVLNQLMETYKGTLFRQTMFAEFEKDIHALSEAGEPLTADILNDRYYKLVKKYFGKNVVCDKQIRHEWQRIPHFYSCFYVYKYATCISAASAIVKRIETEGDAYVEKYLNFLKCGDSKSPLESLLLADIDMTKPEVVQDAIDDFANAVAQFKELNSKKVK